MALKNRVAITLSIEPETKKFLEEIAQKENRPTGRQLDVLIKFCKENYPAAQ